MQNPARCLSRDHSYLTGHLMDCSPARRDRERKRTSGGKGRIRSVAWRELDPWGCCISRALAQLPFSFPRRALFRMEYLTPRSSSRARHTATSKAVGYKYCPIPGNRTDKLRATQDFASQAFPGMRMPVLPDKSM